MLGHVPQLGKALQSLKHQLNLPTHTVRSQNVRRRTAGADRKHDHVLYSSHKSARRWQMDWKSQLSTWTIPGLR